MSNIIQSFNTSVTGYSVYFAHESGWIKAIHDASRKIFIFQKVNDKFVLRGESSDPNVSSNYNYFTDVNKQFISRGNYFST